MTRDSMWKKIGELEDENLALAARLAEAERLLRAAIALDSGDAARKPWLEKYQAYFDAADSATPRENASHE